MWRNDIKCKYMFLFPLNNLAHKGLIQWGLDKNGWHFADDIYKHILLCENSFILLNISLKFVPRGRIVTIIQHWFRGCLGAEQATSHYLKQGWPSLLMHTYMHHLTSICTFKITLKWMAQDFTDDKLTLVMLIGGLPVCVLSYFLAWHWCSSGQQQPVVCTGHEPYLQLQLSLAFLKMHVWEFCLHQCIRDIP